MEEINEAVEAMNAVKGPITKQRHWVGEITRAKKVAKPWLNESKEIQKLYDGSTKNVFNILSSNTDTIRPAVYNSTPEPDIRRRFRDQDEVGKEISKILERVVSYENDELDFDDCMNASVLDSLLPGRGIATVEYDVELEFQYDENGDKIPERLPSTEVDEEGNQIPGEIVTDEDGEPVYLEQVSNETAPIRHHQYDDFLIGPGKCWEEVTWVAFRFKFTKKELEKKFGKGSADNLAFTDVSEEEATDDKDENQKMATCDVWKVWDKDTKTVLFINETAREPLHEEEDPLHLKNFFPCPRPLFYKKDQTSLKPIPPYRVYKSQAEELNRVAKRRNTIIQALKVRGAYNASLGDDIHKIFRAGTTTADLELVPIANAQQLEAVGGLNNAIWIMPLQDFANALNELYKAEAQIKNTIYEITGIADIMRGASTGAKKTATEQRIKSEWGSLRIQDLQRDVQRYARDLIRLKTEIIAEHYDQQTLAAISGVELPPESWEVIMQTMKSDKMRCYKIDIETDSTIQETLGMDMQGLSEVTNAVTNLINSYAPLVQAGVLPLDALKEMTLAVIRRARLGSAVEEYFAAMTMEQAGPEGQQPPEEQPVPEDPQQAVSAAEQLVQQNQANEQQMAEIQQAMVQFQNMQSNNETSQQTAQMLQSLIAQLSQSKAVDVKTVQTMEQMQQAYNQLGTELATQFENLAKQISSPKVVEFVRDEEGKIKNAVAVVGE